MPLDALQKVILLKDLDAQWLLVMHYSICIMRYKLH